MDSLESCRELAQIIHQLADSQTIIGLDGQMGAGKTQWTKFFLQIDSFDGVESPTFSLHNTYETKNKRVHHFDLHRLDSGDELDSIGFWETLNKQELIIIEWSSHLSMEDYPYNKKLLFIKIDAYRNVDILSYAALAED